MNNIHIGGADSNWYKEYHKTEVVRKYHKLFRQPDTLLNIPKILEDKVRLADKDAYNSAVDEANERVSKIAFDEIVSTLPEEAAIKQPE